MAVRDLPEIYALSPRACGPQALGTYFRQIPRNHDLGDDSTPSEKLLPCFGSLFILDFENFNRGKNVRATTIVINISVTFE